MTYAQTWSCINPESRPFIFRQSPHRQAQEGRQNQSSSEASQRATQPRRAGSKARGTCEAPCPGRCAPWSEGLALPASLPELAASRARQGGSLPVSKAGWQAVGTRPWPEAAGVLAKRAGIHAPYPKSQHSGWDAEGQASWTRWESKVSHETWGAGGRGVAGHSCYRGHTPWARKLLKWLASLSA